MLGGSVCFDVPQVSDVTLVGRRWWRATASRGEGSEGDALRPQLIALGQHPALETTQSRLDVRKKSSLFCKKSSSSLNNLGWVWHTELFRRSCSTIVTFESTQGKHRFGTREASAPKLANSLRGLPSSQIPMPVFGKGLVCQKRTKGCALSGHLSATPVYVEVQLETLTRTPGVPGSHSSQISSARAHCCCTAHQPGTHFIREVRPECSFSFAQLRGCGRISASCWTSLVTECHNGSWTVARFPPRSRRPWPSTLPRARQLG